MNQRQNQFPQIPNELFSAEQAREVEENGFMVIAAGSLPVEAVAPALAEDLSTHQTAESGPYQLQSWNIDSRDQGYFKPREDKDTSALVITGGHGTASILRGKRVAVASIEPGTVLLSRGNGTSAKSQTWTKLESADGTPISVTSVRSTRDRAESDFNQGMLHDLGGKNRRLLREAWAKESEKTEKRFNKYAKRLGGTALGGHISVD